jgi:hypothetical protein
MSMEDYNFNKARQAWGEQPKQGMNMNEQQRIVGREAIAGGIVGGTIAGASYGTQPSVKPAHPVISEFEHLMNDLDRLGEFMQRLESRLSPILADVPPPPEGDVGRGRDGHSKLSGMLYHAWLKVDALNTQVLALIDRTEV